MLTPRAVTAAAALSLLLAALLPRTVVAQEGPAGVWNGAIATPGQALEVIVTLRPAGDGWTGAIDIPAQNLADFPLSDVEVSDDSVRFAMSGIPGEPVFSGTWDADAATISGAFAQGGASYDFSLTRTGDAPSPTGGTLVDADSAARVVGTWQGNLSTGAGSLRLIFHLRHEDGALTGTMDSPDQGQTGLPISGVSLEGSVIRIDLEYAGAYFEGTLTGDDATIDGAWSQGGARAPLTMQKQ